MVMELHRNTTVCGFAMDELKFYRIDRTSENYISQFKYYLALYTTLEMWDYFHCVGYMVVITQDYGVGCVIVRTLGKDNFMFNRGLTNMMLQHTRRVLDGSDFNIIFRRYEYNRFVTIHDISTCNGEFLWL